jgi:hypothetical protein
VRLYIDTDVHKIGDFIVEYLREPCVFGAWVKLSDDKKTEVENLVSGTL